MAAAQHKHSILDMQNVNKEIFEEKEIDTLL